MDRIPALVSFLVASAVAPPLLAQQGFTQPWTDAPVTEISRADGETGITVTYQSGEQLAMKRGNQVAEAQVAGCSATLEVFFTCFPEGGKMKAGLNLGAPGGAGDQNDFGCQIVMIFTQTSGSWTNLNVKQIITDLVLKIIHNEANPAFKELCMGPTPPALPRFDVTVDARPTEFVQVSEDTWVFADAPRFQAFDLGEAGFPLGSGATTPPGGNVLHAGDGLKFRRSFITYWFGECQESSSSVRSLAAAGDPLLFYVRWCCAHELVTAATAAGWKGKCIHCDPGEPQVFSAAPPPDGGAKQKDFNDATQQLNAAGASRPYSLVLNETLQALPMCPKGF
jgi:hypothetical protein